MAQEHMAEVFIDSENFIRYNFIINEKRSVKNPTAGSVGTVSK